MIRSSVSNLQHIFVCKTATIFVLDKAFWFSIVTFGTVKAFYNFRYGLKMVEKLKASSRTKTVLVL